MYERYYRSIRTTQERRANGKHNPYCRRRRNDRNLPNSWDDIVVDFDIKKSWKEQRKTQYRCGGRGKLHAFYISYTSRRDYWDIEQYLKEQDIPCRVEEDSEIVYRKVWWLPQPPHIKKFSIIKGHIITYWTDKKIDLTRVGVRV